MLSKIKYIYRKYRYLYGKFLKFCEFVFGKYVSIKSHKIVFNNFNGKGYGDNPMYICEEMIKQKLPYDLVWLVRNNKINVPPKVKKANYNGILGRYHIASAKVVITNVKNRLPFKKKNGQYVIQTWHAMYGPKYAEKDAQDYLNPNYIEDSKENSRITDLFISSNTLQTAEYLSSFWCKCEIMECGYPRNDIYFNSTINDINLAKKRMGIPVECHLALYAPTFRDDKSIDCYSLDTNLLLKTLNEKYTGKWIILIRFHPNVVQSVGNLFHFDNSKINVTSYPNMQELLLISDILITDYSSSMYEFAIMKKPVFLFVPDLHKNIRPLKPSFYTLPFPFATTNKELNDIIYHFEKDEYLTSLNEFLKTFVCFDDGHASERVVERIKMVIEGTFKLS